MYVITYIYDVLILPKFFGYMGILAEILGDIIVISRTLLGAGVNCTPWKVSAWAATSEQQQRSWCVPPPSQHYHSPLPCLRDHILREKMLVGLFLNSRNVSLVFQVSRGIKYQAKTGVRAKFTFLHKEQIVGIHKGCPAKTDVQYWKYWIDRSFFVIFLQNHICV